MNESRFSNFFIEKRGSFYASALHLELHQSYSEQVRQIAVTSRRDGLTFELPKMWLHVVPPRVLIPAQRVILNRL